MNGEFSWKKFFLGFLTRKFLIAVGIQIVVTYLAYDAFEIVMETAKTGKGSVDPKTIIEIFERWCYFTIANAGTFGLFNSTSKYANNSLEKIKKLAGLNKTPTQAPTQAPAGEYKDPREGS